jgi:hypothetical protein
MIGHPRANASAPAAIAVSGDVESASTTYIGTQVLGVSSVPLAVAAKDPGPVFAAADLDRFTGREWLTGEVDRVAAEYPCGYVFLTAEAGLGKTAFAAWLVKTRGYLSHFSRHADGRSVRGALQNLSAQLIRSFGLDDQAPGGQLPDWAWTPAGFESLLGMAADRTRQEGRRLVVVVDGLDEADPSADGLPFGLPSLLPAGVFVIGTYRSGYVPRQPDAPVATIPILKNDPRNRDDIRQFLDWAVSEQVLAARLAAAAADPAVFAAELAGRCGGVWVYLRYVVEEVRLGLRQPASISDLPARLRSYYADQIRTWQKDPAWEEVLLPLAATLAVADEPLAATALARLAGDLDPATARRLCNLTFRPLLTTTRAGSVLRYEIYHASFREVLKARYRDDLETPDGDVPGELEELADELTQAAAAAHCRIADTYLRGFGGLAAGLPLLAADPGAAGIDDGYPLRHLVRHLDHAGRHQDMHRLLAASHPAAGGGVSNVWFSAHDYADCVSSYLDDLTRARQASARATDRSVARRLPAPTLGTEIRYALMAASILSRTTRISPGLLELLITTGVWSAPRGLDHARRLPDPADRFQALMAVYASRSHGSASLAEALAAATAITDDSHRARALGDLAPHLPPDLLSQALAAATALTDDADRAVALTGLAPHLPPDLLSQALAAASARTSDYDRTRALTDLVPHLPADQQPGVLDQALAAATALTSDYDRARALTDLVPHLPPDQQPRVLDQALAAATALTDDYDRGQVLTGLAPHLPPDLLSQALAAAIALHWDYARAAALTGLAPHLPADLLSQALAAATALTGDSDRVRALTGLAPHLPADQQPGVLGQALAAVPALPSDYARTEALTGLAPHLPPDLLGQALAAATALPSDHDRARALTGLAPHLPAGLVGQALATAMALTWDSARAEALTGLVPHLPADQQPRVLGQALAAATALTDDYDCARTLADLVPHLPADQQPRVLGQALAAATALTGDYDRVRALADLVPHLPADQQPGVLGQALAAVPALPDDFYRARALSDLAPHLPADLLGQALATATNITDDSHRARALSDLAPHLPPDLLSQALTAATAITDHYYRSRALSDLAPHLPPDLLGPVVAQLDTALASDYVRTRALADLAPHLPPDLLSQALAAATALTGDSDRTRALTELLPHLPADQQPGVLGQALAAATAITDDYYQARVLAGLVPHLPPDLLPGVLGQALAAAAAITDDYYRSRLLTGLAPHLPAHLIGQALAVTSDGSTEPAVALLKRGVQLSPEISKELFLNLLRSCLVGIDRRSCLRALSIAASQLKRISGSDVIYECVEAIEDVHQWWP